MPWFDEVGSPLGLVKFIQEEERVNELTVGFAPFFRRLYLGLSLIFVGKINEGTILLEGMFQHLQGYDRTWLRNWKETIDPLLKPGINVDDSKAKLREFSQYSMQKIGIKLSQ